MEIFEDDDDGYRDWIQSHQDGYVLNAERDTLDTYHMRLHRADCHTLVPTHERRWTCQYIKVCSTDVDEIIDWVCRKYGEEPKRCGKTKDCKNI